MLGSRPAEIHRERAERIVGTGRHARRQDVALRRVFPAHGFGRRPDRILALRHDLRGAFGSCPADHADADRHSRHDTRFTLRGFWKIVQAQRRKIDDHAVVGRVRQHELRRQHDPRAFPGQPGIDTRVCIHDLVVAKVEAARDVGKRVFVGRNRRLQRADHRRGLRVVRKSVRREGFSVLRSGRLSGRGRQRLLLRRKDAAARERDHCDDEYGTTRVRLAGKTSQCVHVPPSKRRTAAAVTAPRVGSAVRLRHVHRATAGSVGPAAGRPRARPQPRRAHIARPGTSLPSCCRPPTTRRR